MRLTLRLFLASLAAHLVCQLATAATVTGSAASTARRRRSRSTTRSSARDARVSGVEFNYQQFFSQLPGAFAGLGLSLNYTKTDSSVTVFGRTDVLPFFKQADEIGNVALLYEKYGIEARVALSFNSAYLEAVGADRAGDEYTDRRRPLDIKVSYRLTPRLRLFADFLNVGKEPLRTYQGEPGRSNGYEIYSWNANVGVNWRL